MVNGDIRMSWTNCPSPVFQNCIKVEFGNGKSDIALMKQKYQNTQCVLEGYFQSEIDNRIAVTTDCPITGNSIFQVIPIVTFDIMYKKIF